MSKVYTELTKLNSPKTNNPIKEMGRRHEPTFLQRRRPDTQQTLEKMLIIPHPQNHKSKSQRRITSHLSEWLKPRTQETTAVGEDVE